MPDIKRIKELVNELRDLGVPEDCLTPILEWCKSIEDMPVTLADDFLSELKRVKELKTAYDGIPTGVVGAGILAEIIGRADLAWDEMDVTAMISILPELKECE